MAFSPQFLDELRARVSLADVVGRRVRLAKKGREHQGLCPFHKEKTPSFTLNEDKGFYHCFGCGAHGSVFDFVMQTEGLNFPEAVERLANDAGMEVPVDSPEERQRQQKRETLLGAMEKAGAFFQKKLFAPEGKVALDYLRGRGLSDDLIKRFGLGYAPNDRDAIKGALANEKVPEGLMLEGGLIKKPDDGRAPFGYFRNRVMFPITDRQGRIIAFGGRILGDGEPKYLNSPETALFHKGRTLYGLHQALAGARKAGRLLVVEGYMDVIGLARGGIDYAVAPLGTALTEDQIRLLWRINPEPILCFDGDNAGARAAARAAERALPHLKPGFGLRFATLPQGEDPDDLIKRGGAEALEQVLAAAEPVSAVLWRIETQGRTVTSPEDRAGLEKRLDDHVRRIEDPTVRAHFQRGFRDKLRGPFQGRGGASGGFSGQKSGFSGQKRGFSVPRGGFDAREGTQTRVNMPARREEVLLATLINHPDLYDDISERLGTIGFSAPALDSLRQEVLKTLAQAHDLDSEGLKGHLTDSGFGEILAPLLGPRVYDHAFFARADANPADAREGWEETFVLHRRSDLETELEEAIQELEQNITPEAVERVRLLRQQCLEATGMENDHDF